MVAAALASLGLLPVQGQAMVTPGRYALCDADNGLFSAWLDYNVNTLTIQDAGYFNNDTGTGDVAIYQNGVLAQDFLLAPNTSGTDRGLARFGLKMTSVQTKAGPSIGLPTGWDVGCGYAPA